MNRILLVDDDERIVEFTSIALENQHYLVFKAYNGHEALALLEQVTVDLAVVDVMMPKMDGWEFTRNLKEFYDIPVLFLTARGEIGDKIKGFGLGADDYLVKPFLIEELVIRIEALLRRYQLQQNVELAVGKLVIVEGEHCAKLGQHLIELAPKEFQLLSLLAHSKGTTISRETLITTIWGYDYQGDERTLDVHVKRLRQRLSDVSSGVVIKTVRGLGYRLEEVDE